MTHVTLRDGKPLYVRVVGRGKPVLLLHGMGMNSGHWLPFILPFLRDFRFHMPDFRGAGRSSATHLNQPDIFQNHMEDVQDVIRHFQLRDFLLAGYSLGGSVSLHLQRAGGFDDVRRYLHIDQSACIGNRAGWNYGLWGDRQAANFVRLSAFADLLNRHADVETLGDLPRPALQQAMAILSETLPAIAGKPAMQPVLKAASRWPNLFLRFVPTTHIGDFRAYLAAYLNGGHDYRESLAACTVPVTFMVGMRSPLYPAAGQIAIAGRVRENRIVRFEKSDHVPLVDQPLRFVSELGKFLRG